VMQGEAVTVLVNPSLIALKVQGTEQRAEQRHESMTYFMCVVTMNSWHILYEFNTWISVYEFMHFSK
jgi:hypothetical protein